MKELIEYIVKSLVEKPEEVVISESDNGMATVIEVRVANEDAGKVIGREGRIANALRTLAKAAGAKDRKRISVEIITKEER
ncbi:MAG TPA: KH domain-containing protein [Candidatus Omnitrophota bacterium]|nr:KH domain-containing protein [Candidatus Omnitrophota bacterium]